MGHMTTSATDRGTVAVCAVVPAPFGPLVVAVVLDGSVGLTGDRLVRWGDLASGDERVGHSAAAPIPRRSAARRSAGCKGWTRYGGAAGG